MRHRRQTHRLGRNHNERTAMLENLVSSLLVYQQVKTTLQKAKAAQRLADRVITLGKADTLAARRKVFSYLQDHQLTSKIFKEVAPRFKSRIGGYTRILHLDRRKGDGAQLALLELTEKEIRVKEEKKSKKATKEEKSLAPGAAHDEKAESHAHPHPHVEKEKPFQKEPPQKQEKPKGGFFKNLGKFFRNKGGG